MAATTVKVPASVAIEQAFRAMRALLSQVPSPEDRLARRAVGNAAADLRDWLEMYDAVQNDILSWEHVDPELGNFPEPRSAALDKIAEEAGDAAERLTEVIARYCGTGETGARERGRDGGNWDGN